MFTRFLSFCFSKESFFLFGPRQVGKSTILDEIPCLLKLDLLDPSQQLAYAKNPNLLILQTKNILEKKEREHCCVIIDEVQRVPPLLDVVQILIKEYPSLQFIMSGSSARKLKRGHANLLGGRAVYHTLHPLTFTELGKHFDLEKVLSFGSLPKIYSILLEDKLELAQNLLRSYIITYLKEEIQEEALTRNIQGFQNFLEIAVAQFAEQINYSEVARESLVSYTTVREYYSILEDTLIGYVLQPYLRSKRKRMSHAPKFYFFDNGVTQAAAGTLKSTLTPQQKGRLFEQWIVQEVQRINLYYQQDWKLSFWRTAHGAEVDFIIERGREILFAIECKYKTTISGADLSGLKAFHDVYPKVPLFVVAPVAHSLKFENVSVFSPQELFQRLLS